MPGPVEAMLAVAGGKGGCGKTTTALGLAAAFADQRRRPLAVDADADMPNLHAVADVAADRDEPRLDAVATGTSPRDAARPSGRFPGVDVLPGTPGVDLAAALRALRGLDRPVVVDTAAGASEVAVHPLRAADAAFVVTTPRPQSVEDALKTAAMARALDTPVAGVVVNRADDVPDGVAAAFDAPVVAVLPAVGRRPLSDPRVQAALDGLAADWSPDRPEKQG
ncbi:MinD/ParA family protein [Halobacteriaceae archaeon GCM10025711]